jgi:hypothetical protein
MLLQLPDEAFSIWPKITIDGNTAQVAHLGILLDMYVVCRVRSANLTQEQTCLAGLEVSHATYRREHRRHFGSGGHNDNNFGSLGRVLK